MVTRIIDGVSSPYDNLIIALTERGAVMSETNSQKVAGLTMLIVDFAEADSLVCDEMIDHWLKTNNRPT